MLNIHLRNKVKAFFCVGKYQKPTIIPRKKHELSRRNISPNALKVLYRIHEAGYDAYLVGGGVRDVLLNCRPKDFDVVTDAHPEDLRQLFLNSRIIGRRFRLLHVFFSNEIIEVSTFRRKAQEEIEKNYNPNITLHDNTYGTIQEDAWRRDFTINSFYYNIADLSLVDFTGGLEDLKHRTLRMIGDPEQRYHEDPIRLLRAIRLSGKLKLTISPETEVPLKNLSGLLQYVPKSRLFDECLKLFFDGHARSCYKALKNHGYLSILFPALKSKKSMKLIQLAIDATDRRFCEGLSLNPGFLLSVFLWPALLHHLDKNKKSFIHFYQALQHSIDQVLIEQNETLRIPKRFTGMMRAVWVMQFQLLRRHREGVYRILQHRYFRAAYNFLGLRVQSGEPYEAIYAWWEQFQLEAHEKKRNNTKIG